MPSHQIRNALPFRQHQHLSPALPPGTHHSKQPSKPRVSASPLSTPSHPAPKSTPPPSCCFLWENCDLPHLHPPSCLQSPFPNHSSAPFPYHAMRDNPPLFHLRSSPNILYYFYYCGLSVVQNRTRSLVISPSGLLLHKQISPDFHGQIPYLPSPPNYPRQGRMVFAPPLNIGYGLYLHIQCATRRWFFHKGVAAFDKLAFYGFPCNAVQCARRYGFAIFPCRINCLNC